MALEDFTDSGYKSVWRGGNYAVKWFQAGDGNMKAGLIAEYDDADEIKILTADTGLPFGVVGDLPTVDLDTAISAGSSLYIFLRGSGARVTMAHDDTVEALTAGMLVETGTVAGTCFKQAAAGIITAGIVMKGLAAAADKFVPEVMI